VPPLHVYPHVPLLLVEWRRSINGSPPIPLPVAAALVAAVVGNGGSAWRKRSDLALGGEDETSMQSVIRGLGPVTFLYARCICLCPFAGNGNILVLKGFVTTTIKLSLQNSEPNTSLV
jgi:hypothetical protein